MAPLLAALLSSEISRFQPAWQTFSSRPLCERSSSSAPVCLRRAACLLLCLSLDAESAPQAHSVAASRWAYSRCFHPPTHPSAHQRLPRVLSAFVLRCSARTHSPSVPHHSAAAGPGRALPLPGIRFSLFLSLCFLFFLLVVRLDPSGPLPLFLAGVRFLAHAHACTLRLGSSMDYQLRCESVKRLLLQYPSPPDMCKCCSTEWQQTTVHSVHLDSVAFYCFLQCLLCSINSFDPLRRHSLRVGFFFPERARALPASGKCLFFVFPFPCTGGIF